MVQASLEENGTNTQKLYEFPIGTRIHFLQNLPESSILEGETGTLISIEADNTVILAMDSGASVDIEPDQNPQFRAISTRGFKDHVLGGAARMGFAGAERIKTFSAGAIGGAVGGATKSGAYSEMQESVDEDIEDLESQFDRAQRSESEDEGENIVSSAESEFGPSPEEEYEPEPTTSEKLTAIGGLDVGDNVRFLDGKNAQIISSQSGIVTVKFADKSLEEFDGSYSVEYTGSSGTFGKTYTDDSKIGKAANFIAGAGAGFFSKAAEAAKTGARASPGLAAGGARGVARGARATPGAFQSAAKGVELGAQGVRSAAIATGEVTDSLVDAFAEIGNVASPREKQQQMNNLEKLYEESLVKSAKQGTLNRAQVDTLGALKQQRGAQERLSRVRSGNYGGAAVPAGSAPTIDDGGLGDIASGFDGLFDVGEPAQKGSRQSSQQSDDIGNFADDILSSFGGLIGEEKSTPKSEPRQSSTSIPGTSGGLRTDSPHRNRRINIRALTNEDIRVLYDIWRDQDEASFNEIVPRYERIDDVLRVFRNNYRRHYNNVKDLFLNYKDRQLT